MAYEVTATRRRPKTFDELAGQEFVAATLKNSLETGHIAHAYLFSGPRGCGKTSAARILARSLRCEKGPTASPCGVCPQCLEIATGASMDVIEIDGASNTSVNDVRQIKEEVLFPPSTGRFKVYIIDEVHMLSNSAFNALLKTIEEPPPNIVFIFATTELQKVPATIKSRCQQFNFRLIPIETIVSLLKTACGELNITAEEEALFWIAREATGSLRDAYTIFDQVVSFSDGHLRPELIREKLGLVGLDKLNELADACAGNDLAGAWSLIDNILNSGVAVEQLVIDLAGYYHNLFLIKAGIERESILGYSPERFSAKVREALDIPRLSQAQELLFALHRDLRFSLSPRFELETLAAKLCWLDRWVSPGDLCAAVEQARSLLFSAGDSRGNSPGDVRGAAGTPGGIARPLAGGAPRGAPYERDSFGPDDEKFLKEGFNRALSAPAQAGGGAAPAAGGALGVSGGDEDPAHEEPALEAPALPPVKSAPPEEEDPHVQRVLEIFRGTIIK